MRGLGAGYDRHDELAASVHVVSFVSIASSVVDIDMEPRRGRLRRT
jgi:hypothetical protein